MYEMTLGEVLVDYECMAAYVSMTSPWGSGDGTPTTASHGPTGEGVRDTVDIERARSADFVRDNGGVLISRPISHMPEHLRGMLGH
jgi:hypothetical protein